MAACDHGHHVLLGGDQEVDWGRPAVFLDRDGVINKEVHLLHKLEDLILIPQARALGKLTQHHYPLFVVTNQTVAARGLCNSQTVSAINRKVLRMLSSQETSIVALYCCMHSEKADVAAYRKVCSWRKPASGILRAIARKYPIHLNRSYVVGDQARDLLMGHEVGAATIMVLTGHGGKDALYSAQADYVVADIGEAVNIILKGQNGTG